MKSPFISATCRRPRPRRPHRHSEHGITLLLVAVAMLAIIGMAALAIDVVTLYLAREEAQRAADAGALAGARILSLSGVTGDPNDTDVTGTTNTIDPWNTACTLATQVAQAVASQNSVNSAVAGTPKVTINGGTVNGGCSSPSGTVYELNPQVQVQVVQNSLPTLFSRIWSRTANTISATATAEAYNPSTLFSYNGDAIAVVPRCVKPWIIPNMDPWNAGAPLVNVNGGIVNQGIQASGSGTGTGIIGESLTLTNTCKGGNCKTMEGGRTVTTGPEIDYAPALISTSPAIPPTAIPNCANDSGFQQAIGGCDQTVYACAAPNAPATIDFTVNPWKDTDAAVNCLIRSAGPDTMDYSGGNFPFPIKAGPANPYASTGQAITSSTSIVTLPIFDSVALGKLWPSTDQPNVTIVGFLQVFIDNENTGGTINAHVLNVSGCGNSTPSSSVNGSSPVPVRLITPP